MTEEKPIWDNLLPMWVIYDHPRDHPDHFVARKWLIGPGYTEATLAMFAALTLDELRDMLPPGLVRIGRKEDDEAVILEVWI